MRRHILVLLVLIACTLVRADAPTTQSTQTVGLINAAMPLKLEQTPAKFTFAVLADRTGGERKGVFPAAIGKLNLMRPDFVMSVGDLIEGYIDHPRSEPFDEQVAELDRLVAPLRMPLFYTVGNHDMSSPRQAELWHKRFGPDAYYSFTYRGVLFLVLCTMPAEHLTDEQVAWAQRVLEQNRSARWTMVFMHHPIWRKQAETLQQWQRVEKALGDRPYTVFAGHIHRYSRAERNGRAYYVLATTGGVSKLNGPASGEFDHIMWVTMTEKGPVIANLQPQAILSDNPSDNPSSKPTTRPGK